MKERIFVAALVFAALVLVVTGLTPVLNAQGSPETRFGDALRDLDFYAVRKALSEGADPNERYGGTGLSAIHQVTIMPFFGSDAEGAALNQLEEKAILVLEVLFKAGAEIRYYDKESLHGPAMYGANILAKYLLDRGADPNGADRDGNTPVILATKYGHPETVELLIQHGAKPLAESTTAQIRFVVAARRGDLIAMRKELSKGANVNRRTPTKETALLEAISNHHFMVVKELLSLGADPNLSGSSIGTLESPLHAAVFKNRVMFKYSNGAEIVKLLLKNGAHVSSTDAYKRQTPLHLAARVNNEIATKILLEAGSKIMPRDADGNTPLDLAEAGPVIKLLKSYGAEEIP